MAKSKGSSGKSSDGPKSHLQYRNAGNGRFVTDKQADRMKPENVVHERVPNPGFGDSD